MRPFALTKHKLHAHSKQILLSFCTLIFVWACLDRVFLDRVFESRADENPTDRTATLSSSDLPTRQPELTERLGQGSFPNSAKATKNVAVPEKNVAVPEKNVAVPETAQQISLSFSPVVKKTRPAVVNVYTRKLITQRRTLFDEMFGENPFFSFDSPLLERKSIKNSLGSGVLISPTGMIVTNSHVVNEADEIVIVTSDRHEYEASILLELKEADLAFLQIKPEEIYEGQGFPFLEFANSDLLEVGDLVLAIGNPFGVGQTVTSGIISAVSRTGIVGRDNNLFIQTDAAINPGNSGGALVDMQGKLAGINSAIFSRSGESNGIGFAVPANLVALYLRDLENENVSDLPWLGFIGQSLNSDLTRKKGLISASGVVIDEVFKGGPVDRAGIKPGDVIVAVNGMEVFDRVSLLYRLRLLSHDKVIHLDILSRDGISTYTIANEDPPEAPSGNPTLVEGTNPLSGMIISNLSPKASRDRRLNDTWSGVIVDRVYRNSFAKRYGFQQGDVLLELNGQEIRTISDLNLKRLDMLPVWNIKINRDGYISSLKLLQ